MHSVTESASLWLAPQDDRARRRRRTARDITDCAQRLTAERGLDGFTMDELATEAGVSRRTLFNYFGGKESAVLGLPPTVSPEQLDQFVAHGSRDLLSDITAVVVAMLEQEDLSRQQAGLQKRVLHENPRLLQAALSRCEELIEFALPRVAEREGEHYDEASARLAITLMATFVGQAIHTFIDGEDDGPSVGVLLEQTVATARTLLCPGHTDG